MGRAPYACAFPMNTGVARTSGLNFRMSFSVRLLTPVT